MGRTVTITIHYDADPPFTQRVRDLVDAIFASCFGSLDDDRVVIVWALGTVPDSALGKNKTFDPTAWDFNLESTLSWPGANGQTGDNSCNINPTSIASDALSVGGDADVATANTIAHEIGLHGIAGDIWHGSSDGGTHDVDRDRLSRGLCHGPGQWSRDVCAEMKDELDVS
jgi:hypothetical protein